MKQKYFASIYALSKSVQAVSQEVKAPSQRLCGGLATGRKKTLAGAVKVTKHGTDRKLKMTEARLTNFSTRNGLEVPW